LPLSVLDDGFPDFVYLLVASALVALVWAVVKAVWTYAILRSEHRDELVGQVAAA
jgi:heme exporter protein D